MNIKNLRTAVKVAAMLGRTIVLVGEHGTGKSEIIKQIYKDLGYNAPNDVRLGQMADAADLIGLPEFHVDENGMKYTKYVLPDFFPRQPNTPIFFDEMNRAGKDLLQGIFELVLDYSLKGNPLPANCPIICAINPSTSDYSTLDFNDQAFQDRFIWVKFTPSEEEFFEYMTPKYKSSGLLAYTKENKKMLRNGDLEAHTLNFVKPSRRSWEVAFRLEEMYDKGEMNKDVFMEMLQGVVGDAAAIAGLDFKDNHVVSLNGKDMLENYHTGDIRSRLLRNIDTNRKDIIHDALTNIEAEFKARTGLTNQEAQNVIDIIKDLAVLPDVQYSLGTHIKNNLTNCTGNCEGFEMIEPDKKGLGYSTEIVAMFKKTRAARDKAKEEQEKKNAAKQSEEVPF